MSIVLHIGLPKTGSTALQNWAFRNRVALAAEGVFVLPAVLDAHRLAVELITSEKRLQASDIAPIRERSFEDAKNALLEGSGAANITRTLVSSEYFFLSDPAAAAAMFADIGVPVSKVLCFVRRQDELLASGYNQDVKGLGKTEAFVVPPYARIYDWGTLRDDWQAAFPAAEVVLHNYDHHRRQRTLIDVLARDLGASSTFNVARTSSTNESLCAELLEVVRVANGAGLRDIAALAVEVQDAGFEGTPFEFADDIRAAILADYAESNARIAAMDSDGEFADFALDSGAARNGADMTGAFPVEYVLRLLLWLAKRNQPSSEDPVTDNPPVND